MGPTFWLFCGALFVLNGTVLYWAFERLRDWQATIPVFAETYGFDTQHRILVSIRNHPKWRFAFRTLLTFVGFVIIFLATQQ